MRIKAMALRIFHQIRRDRRTLALVLLAPMLLISLLYVILDSTTTDYKVGIVNAPESYIDKLYENNVDTIRLSRYDELEAIETGAVIATVNQIGGKLYVKIDGTNSSKATSLLKILELAAKEKPEQSRADTITEIDYIYGSPELSVFDHFGSTLIGIIVFFFVFLISGISFLGERTSGTLEKLLSTPIKRWEIVVGYAVGFGALTIVQSALITFFVVYVLDVAMVGSLWLVLLITLLSALAALTLGTLISSAAASEFQMIQFIPIIIVPQIFFSGLFDLSPGWSAVGKAMPLYYVADALNKVMIKGDGLSAIALDIVVLVGFSTMCMVGNTLLLKKYRRV